jgi:hypothetical protein
MTQRWPPMQLGHTAVMPVASSVTGGSAR